MPDLKPTNQASSDKKDMPNEIQSRLNQDKKDHNKD